MKTFYDRNAVLAQIATELPAAALPGEIQWMPPGHHQVTARRGGEAVELLVRVDAQAAAVVQSSFEAMMARAASNKDAQPFFDFDHADGEASAWPRRFFWAGEDPLRGGIRCTLEWSDAGAAAVRGKRYRRFSPSFLIDDASGRLTGLPINCGGVCNRPAFKTIAPLAIAAKAGDVPAEKDAAYYASHPEEYEAFRRERGLGVGAVLGKSGVCTGNPVAASFAGLADAISARHGRGFEDACITLAEKCPAFYRSYCASLGLNSARDREKQAEGFNHPWLVKLHELAKSTGQSDIECFRALKLTHPELWEDYRKSVSGPTDEELAELVN